ncbi:iron-sulfur cluster assembly scaffold protein [Sneathiella glossodoripedis]|uniref:iron-sulfur cluster assembly scaffold protein n=1 Tax=Sneathiella glossodoripedis TaxID=418853 RepID=UPI00046F5A59|nr:iron-sulfur cluster assembly scaffold protein [Sneathiella glossodoripedis]
MIEELYQKNLMRLAANATGSQKLENPHFTETLDNPTCGDRITLQVKLEDGRITELSQDNRSCLLCQASASLLAENAVGLTAEDLHKVIAQIHKILNGEEEHAETPWEKLEYFTPVHAHKSRHLCVLLPFHALKKILQQESADAP